MTELILGTLLFICVLILVITAILSREYFLILPASIFLVPSIIFLSFTYEKYFK